MVYYIWFDESDKEGEYYTNFYGGILIESTNLKNVISMMNDITRELDITEEIKWQKVNNHTFKRYIKLVDFIFDLLSENLIKIRIFFKNKQYVPIGLTKEQQKAEFPILYYQFIKHGFGLRYSNKEKSNIYLKIHLDNIPLKGEDKKTFIKHLYELNKDTELKKANICIREGDIFEVDSKQHLPLQCMDLILGAICFRLNNKHKEKLDNTNRRGKRTILKEKLYKHINKKLRELRPNFNIGESTGYVDISERWEQPYRHWSFKPSNCLRDLNYSKNSNKKE
ncbi:DUF3800 domain-containing protein [Dysgonomonas termitidis]|uniref:DUF3800 domain-containing protein n=1 Tax=Dysgonomonas termitidis TaxID=1516126 RepID=A0ABV9KSR0_9BACT